MPKPSVRYNPPTSSDDEAETQKKNKKGSKKHALLSESDSGDEPVPDYTGKKKAKRERKHKADADHNKEEYEEEEEEDDNDRELDVDKKPKVLHPDDPAEKKKTKKKFSERLNNWSDRLFAEPQHQPIVVLGRGGQPISGPVTKDQNGVLVVHVPTKPKRYKARCVGCGWNIKYERNVGGNCGHCGLPYKIAHKPPQHRSAPVHPPPPAGPDVIIPATCPHCGQKVKFRTIKARMGCPTCHGVIPNPGDRSVRAGRGLCSACQAPLAFTPHATQPVPVKCYACPATTLFPPAQHIQSGAQLAVRPPEIASAPSPSIATPGGPRGKSSSSEDIPPYAPPPPEYGSRSSSEAGDDFDPVPKKKKKSKK